MFRNTLAVLVLAFVISAPARAAERPREPPSQDRIVKILKHLFGRVVALSPGLTEPKP
jgi:hypothetical protein